MSKQPSLKRNAIALLAMQAINYLVPIVILPYLTHTLGAEEYGAWNLALSLIQYGVLFISFGFNWSSTQKVSQKRYSALVISRIFWETMLAKIILLLVACCSIFIVTISINSLDQIKIIIFILFLQLFAVSIDPLWFLQGLEKLEKISLISALIRLLNIPLLLFFVHTNTDILKVAFIQAFILITISIVNLLYLKNLNIIKTIPFKRLKPLSAIRHSWTFFIGSFVLNLYNVSTTLILGITSTYDQVGIYSAATRIQGAVLGCFLVLTQVIYPRSSFLFKRNYMDGHNFIKKLLKIMIPLTICASLFFYFVIPHAVTFLLGEEFKESSLSLKILAPTIIFVPFSVVFLHCYFLGVGHKKIFYTLPTLLLFFHVLYAIIFSKYFGATGASISTLITELSKFVVLIVMYLIISNRLKRM